MSLEPENIMPVPYQPGKPLELQVLRNTCGDPLFSQSTTAVISKMLSMTMSPVMQVTVTTKSGSTIPAVLKLYDRRFGTDLRDHRNKHVPYTSADEVVFQSLIQRGDMDRILQELDEEKKTNIIPPQPWHLLDDVPEGRAKYEVALWQNCVENFDCETEAYARLESFQGKLIPRLYAHVRLALPDSEVSQGTIASDNLLEQSKLARYNEVKGIILELVPGYDLVDLATSPLAPSDRETWTSIVQAAIDAAHDINKHGIILDDCQPRNVLVDCRSQSPFIIDLAQCSFKDKLIEVWKDYEEAEDWDAVYWEFIEQCDNSRAIGGLMTTRLLRTKGFKPDLKYPDCAQVLEVR
ncbi:hypothetical protein AK830_g9693 [Neonectria ditissima]|uniref:Protein kinase domain-containing protein n=1 Tax=Neonectria ditissima TaxID=78410 RepID=A0A0P7AU69_9HYPO|nr:hypothetical protein AK830_g9693 [Neonectria ditissima]